MAVLRTGPEEMVVKHFAVQGKKKGGDGKSEIRFVIQRKHRTASP